MICAEPLTHVAYGPCGHRDACVECVARLRFVMDDARCVICQQQCPSVFATRAMGDYTETIGASAFSELPKRALRKELHHDKQLNMFFDDQVVCRKVESLRGLQCSVCPTDGAHQNFTTLKQLKQHLRERHERTFCDVCLEGRKVFVTQQLVYTRAQLDSHKFGKCDAIDEPLGGFKGHPSCRFCKGKCFYDESVIYAHMQSAHETCHLCRRASPDTYTYYKDYNELEGHYNKTHFPCLHPECLQKKFVVFHSPQELKNHEGVEHGRQMSKTERKEALRLHVDFNVGFTSDGSGGFGFGGSAGGAQGRGGYHTGGHAGNDSDAARRQDERVARAAGGATATERAQLEAVLRASREDESYNAQPAPPSMEEFPDLGGGGGSRAGGLQVGGWAGRSGNVASSRMGRQASLSGYSSGPAIRNAEEFPSLGGSRAAASVPSRNRQPAPMPEGLPIRASEHLRQKFASMANGASAEGGGGSTNRAPIVPPATDASNFPVLGGNLAGAPGGNSIGFPKRTKASQIFLKREKNARRLVPSSGDTNTNDAREEEDAFVPVVDTKRGGRWNSGALGIGVPDRDGNMPTNTNGKGPSKKAVQQAQEQADAFAINAADRAARNDRLVSSVRTALDKHGASFEVFVNLSTQFKDGRITGIGYLTKVTAMGVRSGEIKELASLMPDFGKQQELFKAIVVSERVRRKDEGVGSSIDAAAALLFGNARTGNNSSTTGSTDGNGNRNDTNNNSVWNCVSCTFRNEASKVRCDVCDFPAMGGGVRTSTGEELGVGGKKQGKKGKGVKISLTAVGGVGVNFLDKFIGGKEKSAWGG